MQVTAGYEDMHHTLTHTQTHIHTHTHAHTHLHTFYQSAIRLSIVSAVGLFLFAPLIVSCFPGPLPFGLSNPDPRMQDAN